MHLTERQSDWFYGLVIVGIIAIVAALIVVCLLFVGSGAPTWTGQ